MNGVIRGTNCSPAISFVPPEEMLCRPTKRRFVQANPPARGEAEKIIGELTQKRAEYIQRALWEVETTCDDHVREMLLLRAPVEACAPVELKAVIEQRLLLLYSDAAEYPAAPEAVALALAQSIAQLPLDVASQALTSGNASAIDWPAWLRVYRSCLRCMREQFSLPGYSPARDPRIAVVNSDSTSLGEKPEFGSGQP